MKGNQKSFLLFACAVVALLGLGMVAGGAYLIATTSVSKGSVQSAQTWKPTEAEILELARDVTRSPEGGEHVKIHCRYRYSFAGQEYIGSTVDLLSDPSEMGTWKEDLYRQLEAAKAGGGRVQCYVDPRNPNRAALYRSFRSYSFWFTLWLGHAVAGLGLGLAAAGAYALRDRIRRNRLELLHPEHPWMWNPAWSGDRIRPVVILVFLPWVACLYALIGAVPLLLLVWPALLRLGGSVQTFGLAGFGIALPVLLLVVALVRTARLWRIRRAFLHLEGIPVFLGQELRGEFVPLPESAIESPVHLRLEFVNTSSKGKSSATLRIPMAESDASRVEAGAFDPAAFAIRIATNDAWPGTDERDMQDRSFWQLTVTVGTGWRRGRLRFPIPLYRRRGRSGPPASPA